MYFNLELKRRVSLYNYNIICLGLKKLVDIKELKLPTCQRVRSRQLLTIALSL